MSSKAKHPEDVLANSWTFSGFLEASGAPETGALVYALASFCRNPSCRVRAVGSCAKHIAKHALKWGVLEIDAMSRVFGLVFELPGTPQAAPKMAQHEPLKASKTILREQNLQDVSQNSLVAMAFEGPPEFQL